MSYTFDQIFAADPSNIQNVATNATVTIFAPGDATKTPVALTTTAGLPLANPVVVNEHGFGPAFISETLDRVAWDGGGFSGFFTAYEGMKNEAVAAREAANAAATAAAAAQAAAADSAQYAVGPTDSQIDAALRRAAVPSNIALTTSPSGLPVPYIMPGANEITVYVGYDGNYYFTS